MDFSEYKQNISIIEVAQYFGYKPDLSKGKKSLEMKNSNGDTIIVFNPQDKGKQAYFNRHNSLDKGDLIVFLKNRVDHILEIGDSEYEKINSFLGKFSGLEVKETPDFKIKKIESFNLADYEVHPSKLPNIRYLTDERGLTANILLNFMDRIVTVRHIKSKYNFTNVGFPLYDLETEEVKGFDLRNWNFKSVTEGTVKSENFWFKNFAPHKLFVIHLYLGESPIDLISFYQLNHRKIDINKSCFLSTGGSFSVETIRSIKKYFPNAITHCLFDNDFSGNLFDVLTETAVNNMIVTYHKNGEKLLLRKGDKEMEFTVADFSIEKARKFYRPKLRVLCHKPKGYVDWNDSVRKLNYNPALK